MPAAQGYKNRIELLQGTLDMLILQTLRWGSQHGYGIAQAIRSGSGEVLQVETGSLYPALHRLESRVGSDLRGRIRSTISEQNTINSLPPGGSILPANTAAGTRPVRR